jgi:hypothetical protein
MNAPARRRHPAWILAGSAAAGLAAVAILASIQTRSAPSHHPTPRSAAEAGTVQNAALYAAYPRVEETYRMAAAVPQVLDGLYCYCDCSENLGHYSLLECFQSDHAAGCDVCLSEALTAYRMTQQGASLAAIRKAIDDVYGA